ncbi:hypothetical protein V1525DRAFT_420365 [Lipomyces kononenkoae]|uniref:Uncharacterized protein n=1 Tax=Lipomyces kononenkoae TaxID=34357 RepID=A0ACC3SXY7_LIPKO
MGSYAHLAKRGCDTENETCRLQHHVREPRLPEPYTPLFTLGTSMPALPEERVGQLTINGDMAGTQPLADQSLNTMIAALGLTSLTHDAVRTSHNQHGERDLEESPEAFIGPLLPTTCDPTSLFIVKPLTPEASPVPAAAVFPEFMNHRLSFLANSSFSIPDPLDLTCKSQFPIGSECKHLGNGVFNGSQYDWCTPYAEPDPEFMKLSYLQAEYDLGKVEVNAMPVFGNYTRQYMISEPEENDGRDEYEEEHVSAHTTVIDIGGNEDGNDLVGNELCSNNENDDSGIVDAKSETIPVDFSEDSDQPEVLTVKFEVVENNNKKKNVNKDVKEEGEIGEIEDVVLEDSDYEEGEKDDESDYDDDQPRKKRRALPKKAVKRGKNDVRPHKSDPKSKSLSKPKPEFVPPPLTESEKRKSAHFIYLPASLLNTLANSKYPSRLHSADFASDVIVMPNPTEHVMYAPPQLPNMDTYRLCEPYMRHLARAYRIRIDDITAQITTAELDRYFTHVAQKRKKPKNVTLTEDVGKAYFRMAYHSGVPGCVDIVISAAMHLSVKLNEYGHDEAKRPENLFIKFKNGLQEKILRVAGDEKIDRSKISTLAGFVEWKFSDITKSIFNAIQLEIAELHKMVHPDYKYKPRKRQ